VRLNLANVVAQLNMFFMLLVALLLKVNLDGTANGKGGTPQPLLYSAIVAMLSLLPLGILVAVCVGTFLAYEEEDDEAEEALEQSDVI
jgi:hypothetical protein